MYEAVYSFNPRAKGEIHVATGDKITQAKDVGNGWVIGYNQRSGETGILPAAYIKPVLPEGLGRSLAGRASRFLSRAKRHEGRPKEADPEQDGQGEKPAKMELALVASRDKMALPPVVMNAKELKVDKKDQKEMEGLQTGRGFERLAFLSKAFQSGRDEHKILKAILGFVVGLFLGALLTVLLHYSYHYTWQAAGIVGGITTLLLCLGLAISIHFRCVVALTLPGVFTARGRATMLSIIAAMMLTGPITNIAMNSQEAATSMACVAELAYNQSLALRGQLQQPVIQIRNSLQNSAKMLREDFRQIQFVFEQVTGALTTVENGVKSVENFLQNAVSECRRGLGRAYDSCSRSFTGTKRDCERTLNSLNPGTQITNIFSGLSLRRRKRNTPLLQASPSQAVLKLKRAKRAGLTDVCKLFDVGKVCDVLKVVDVCAVPGVGVTIVEGLDKLSDSITGFLNDLVDYNITGHGDLESAAEASKSRQEIVNNVRIEIQEKLDVAMFAIHVITVALSTLTLLMLLQSAFYLRKYLTKIKFDNIYISRKFKELDEAWQKSGQPAVLPLRKRETSLYVNSFSVRMSPAERRQSTLGMLTVFMLLVQFAMTVLFDFVLYYVLYLIQKHGSLEFTLTGDASVTFSVGGSGLLARLVRTFVSGLDVETSYSSVLNVTHCLPQPSPPDTTVIYSTISLFIVVSLCVLLQAYGLRLRHRIVAYYYPEQDEARIAYLHREILLKRKSTARETKERLASRGQGRESDRTGILEKLASKKPCCRALFPCLKHKIYRCQNCEEAASTVSRCRGEGCSVLLCEECMPEGSGLCPVCCPEHGQ